MCEGPRFYCHTDLIDTICFIQLCVVFICAITTLYGLHKLYVARDKGYVEHREWGLTCTLVVFITCELLFTRSYVIMYHGFIAWEKSSYPPPPWSVILSYSVIWWSIMALLALRIWKLYFIQQCNVAIRDYCWIKSIHSNADNHDNNKYSYSLENDWFIQYRHKYGNTRWLLRFFIPILVISVSIAPIFSFVFPVAVWPHYFNFMWLLVPIIFSFTILYKLQLFVDIYGIKNELLYSSIGILIGLVIYFSTFCIFSFSNVRFIGTPPADAKSLRLKWAIYSWCGTIVMGSLGLITTLYPGYNDVCMKVGKNSKYSLITKMNMNNVLKNKLGFRIFMKYLITEFSMEALLFLVELIQIKEFCEKSKILYLNIVSKPKLIKHKIGYSFYADKKNEVSVNCDAVEESDYLSIQNELLHLQFCDGLALSPIIVEQQTYNKPDIDSLMKYIYNKYIGRHAKYPISMSYQNALFIKTKLFGVIKVNEINKINENQSVTPTENQSIKNKNGLINLSSNDCDIDIESSSIESESIKNMIDIEVEVDDTFLDQNEIERIRNKNTNLLNIFDDVATELLYCLHESFIRFQNTKDFSIEYSKIETKVEQESDWAITPDVVF